jgi:hypothetical protein
MTCGVCACAGWHVCMCAMVGTILAELYQLLAATRKKCHVVLLMRRMRVRMWACMHVCGGYEYAMVECFSTMS